MKLTDYSKTKMTDKRGKEYKNVYAALKEQLNDVLFCIKKKRKLKSDSLTNSFIIRKHYVTAPLACVSTNLVIDNSGIRYVVYKVRGAEMCRKACNSYYRSYGYNQVSLDVFESARLYILEDLKHTLRQVERNYKINNCRIEDE